MNINKLEELARSATPGVWTATAPVGQVEYEQSGGEPYLWSVRCPSQPPAISHQLLALSSYNNNEQQDANFIAAASPATVLELIALIRKQEQALTDSNLALMEQTELAERCRQQAEAVEAELRIERAALADAVRHVGNLKDRTAAIPVQAGMPAVTVDTPEFWNVAATWKWKQGDIGNLERNALVAHIDAHTAAVAAKAEKAGYVNGYAKATVEHSQRVECIPEPSAPQQHAQPLPKWIDDAKGRDPFTDDLIAYIEGHPVQQHAQGSDPIGEHNAEAAQQKLVEHAQAALSDEQIVSVWQQLGGPECWLKSFGFLQFARAILAASQQPAAAPAIVECEKCNGQGATHYPDGEWEGRCVACKGTGIIPAAAPAIQQEGAELDDGEFLPCPFCGCAPLVQEIEPHKHNLKLGDFVIPDHPGCFTLECPTPNCCGMIADTREELVAAWQARAALAAPARAEVVPDPRPLFERKLADLQQRGYEIIGRILHKDGEYALFDSSCRWLTKPQYQRLMHEQNGSLFAAPSPAQVQPVAVPRERLQNWIDVIHDNERSMGDRLQSLSSIFGGLLRGDAMDKYPLQPIREQQPAADAAQGDEPPLPETRYNGCGDGSEPLYTPEMMRDFYRKGRAAGIEEAAKLIDKASDWGRLGTQIRYQSDAAAIRAIAAKPAEDDHA